MIGDSVTGIEVCKTTGVRSIGLAKNPRRGAELREAGADSIADALHEIAEHPELQRARAAHRAHVGAWPPALDDR